MKRTYHLREPSAIGRQLLRLRKEQGYTQEQLAERTELSVDLIKKLEQGVHQDTRTATLTKLAEALGTDLHNLTATPSPGTSQAAAPTANTGDTISQAHQATDPPDTHTPPTDPTDPDKDTSPWRKFGAILSGHRKKIGMSQRQAAQAIHVHYSTLAKWESGEHKPDITSIKDFDRLCNADGHLVQLYAAYADIDRLKRGALRPNPPNREDDTTLGLHHLYIADRQIDALHTVIATLDRLRESRLVSTEPLTSVHDEGDTMERRAAMQLLTALSAGAAIPAGSLETVLSGVERRLGIPDTPSVEDWEQTVRTYGQLYYSEPPNALIGDLTADLIQVSHLLKREHPPIVRAGLTRIGAQLSALMATDFNDAGNRRAAQLSWRTAHHAADTSGDRNLTLWVRAREADCAFWQNRPPSTITDLIDDVTRRANGAPSVGLAVALEVRAKLLAIHGDTAGATTALHQLSETFEKLPESVTTGRAIGSSIGTSYPEAALHRTRAYVYAFLGDRKEAPDAVDQALATYPPGLAGGNLRLIQALARIHDGDVDSGLEQAVPIVTGVARLTPMRHLIIRQIIKSLPDEAHSLPAARELRALTA